MTKSSLKEVINETAHLLISLEENLEKFEAKIEKNYPDTYIAIKNLTWDETEKKYQENLLPIEVSDNNGLSDLFKKYVDTIGEYYECMTTRKYLIYVLENKTILQ